MLAIHNGKAQGIEAGLLSSPRSAGVHVSFAQRGDSQSVLRVYADIYDILDGGQRNPGVKADYHIMFILKAFKVNEDATFSLMAGPGAALGYTRDKNSKQGLMAGISGMFSAGFSFKIPVTVSLGLSGIVGCMITRNSKLDQTLKLYRSGLTRCLAPELTISYRF